MTSTTRKRTPGCLRCQERHVKCDRQKPSCSSCRSLKYPGICEYGARQLRFRQSRYTSTVAAHYAVEESHAESARSVSCPRQASDNNRVTSSATAAISPNAPTHPIITNGQLGSPNISREYDARCYLQLVGDAATPAMATGHALTLESPTRIPTTLPGMSPASSGNIADASRCYSSSPSPRISQTNVALRPSQLAYDASTLINPDGGLPNQASRLGNNSAAVHPRLSAAGQTLSHSSLSPAASHPRNSLADEVDCKVFQFYLEHAGQWIGIGSPRNYFHSYIPRLALTEPLLLYACLACASHLMCLMGTVEKDVEQHYNDRLLSLLIPLLSSDEATSSNEALLGTTVILRMSEQFFEINNDAQRHLNGAVSLFMDGTDWSPAESDLATSCFWTYLRESIRIAFLREQPCPFDLGHLSLCNDDMTLPTQSEEVWTNRMTFLMVRVANTCWGTSHAFSAAEMKHLKGLLDNWRVSLPDSFSPWCIREVESEPFPLVRHFASWHVVAWQFYYTAKVMLAVYHPNQRPSEGVQQMKRYIETEIVSPTRWLCGLCMSNLTNVGTNLNGSHLMAWCGQFLSGRDEQRQLLEFLTDFSHKTGWPNQTSCQRLREQWAKSKQSWTDC